ncbi:hypothetical protein M9H77_09526 [Catharanthus roseus]|uniref:Uncharacterized protein n=1 Tax=Catharanthus roseus TaxID=4058 RepID=A0ACC0C111_CATRO|nr:hypothetical protein M9H77_09526 [Catharanthus roseus]
MAMTTQTMPSSTEWIQFYHHNLSNEPNTRPTTIFGGQVAESTVVTTTFNSATVPSPRGLGGHNSDHLSPDSGRVSRPIRRRSRASRRTPTTLLNTDTSNFRAMVQQFTGGPNNYDNNPAIFPTMGFQHFPSGANFSFGHGNHVPQQQQIMNPGRAAGAPNRYPNMQFNQQVDGQDYVFGSMNNVNHHGSVDDHEFLPRLENYRTTSSNDNSRNNNNNNSV